MQYRTSELLAYIIDLNIETVPQLTTAGGREFQVADAAQLKEAKVSSRFSIYRLFWQIVLFLTTQQTDSISHVNWS